MSRSEMAQWQRSFAAMPGTDPTDRHQHHSLRPSHPTQRSSRMDSAAGLGCGSGVELGLTYPSQGPGLDRRWGGEEVYFNEYFIH